MWEHRHEWMTTYTKAETYLSENVTDIEIEERLYNFANKFVIERFKVSEWESEEQKKSLGVIGMFIIVSTFKSFKYNIYIYIFNI